MHTHKTLQFFFSFCSFLLSYLWMDPKFSFIPNSKKTLYYKLRLGRLSCLSSFSSFHACSLSMISSYLPSASFSGYSSPDVYYKGSGPDEAKRNALHVTGKKGGPWGDSPNCEKRRHCEYSSHLVMPAFQTALNAFPISHQGTMQWVHPNTQDLLWVVESFTAKWALRSPPPMPSLW